MIIIIIIYIYVKWRKKIMLISIIMNIITVHIKRLATQTHGIAKKIRRRKEEEKKIIQIYTKINP